MEKGWVTFNNRGETNEHDDAEVDAIPDILSMVALYIILTVILKNAFFSKYLRKIKKGVIIEVSILRNSRLLANSLIFSISF